MQLRTRDDKLSLGSVYQLFIVGWLAVCAVPFAAIIVMTSYEALVVGEIKGAQPVRGFGPILFHIGLMVVGFPVIAALQAAVFGGLQTLAVWLYSLWRPLLVTPASDESQAS